MFEEEQHFQCIGNRGDVKVIIPVALISLTILTYCIQYFFNFFSSLL